MVVLVLVLCPLVQARRGGASTSGGFTLRSASANRAGNDEEMELGEPSAKDEMERIMGKSPAASSTGQTTHRSAPEVGAEISGFCKPTSGTKCTPDSSFSLGYDGKDPGFNKELKRMCKIDMRKAPERKKKLDQMIAAMGDLPPAPANRQLLSHQDSSAATLGDEEAGRRRRSTQRRRRTTRRRRQSTTRSSGSRRTTRAPIGAPTGAPTYTDTPTPAPTKPKKCDVLIQVRVNLWLIF